MRFQLPFKGKKLKENKVNGALKLLELPSSFILQLLLTTPKNSHTQSQCSPGASIVLVQTTSFIWQN